MGDRSLRCWERSTWARARAKTASRRGSGAWPTSPRSSGGAQEMSNLMNRLNKLEETIKPSLPGCVVRVVKDEDEPLSAAIDRWCAEHPGEPPPDPEYENTLIIVRVIV